MQCKIDDSGKNIPLHFPSLYKSEDNRIVLVFKIDHRNTVYYIYLNDGEAVDVQYLDDHHFFAIFTYFSGVAHLSN